MIFVGMIVFLFDFEYEKTIIKRSWTEANYLVMMLKKEKKQRINEIFKMKVKV